MRHSEILLDMEHEVLYFIFTNKCTIEGLELRVPNLWSTPAPGLPMRSQTLRECLITRYNSKLQSENKEVKNINK